MGSMGSSHFPPFSRPAMATEFHAVPEASVGAATGTIIWIDAFGARFASANSARTARTSANDAGESVQSSTHPAGPAALAAPCAVTSPRHAFSEVEYWIFTRSRWTSESATATGPASLGCHWEPRAFETAGPTPRSPTWGRTS